MNTRTEDRPVSDVNSADVVRGVVTDTLAGMARSHLASERMTPGRQARAQGADSGVQVTVVLRKTRSVVDSAV